MRTQLEKAQLDFRRQTRSLPRTLYFERLDIVSREYRVIGSISDGWCADEVLTEATGGAGEFNVLISWREGIDQLVDQSNAVRFGSTRLERRTEDAGYASPHLIRLRAQITSGFRSEVR